jgi:hypothetical protein
MISGFNEWAASAQLGHTDSFAELNERRLGIEAEDFIANILTTSPTKEPLLPALGGLPFALEDTITHHVDVLRRHGCQPYFIFNGVTSNGQEERLQASIRATKSIANAWELYGASEPERAVAEFGTLCECWPSQIIERAKTDIFEQLVLSTLITSIVPSRTSCARTMLTSLLRRTAHVLR